MEPSLYCFGLSADAGRLTLLREPRADFIDDGPGKPIGLARHFVRRLIAAFGASDGDFEMLRYITECAGPRFGMIISHDDAEREFAYDRESHIGCLARAWHVVSIREDWARVFA